jgi:hypothetical protein
LDCRTGQRALNIDDAVVSTLTDCIQLDKITPTMFSKGLQSILSSHGVYLCLYVAAIASKQCYDLIESGSFPRFLKSVHFLAIIFRYLSPTLRKFPPFSLMQKVRAEAQGLLNSSNSAHSEWRSSGKGKIKGGEVLTRIVDNSKNSKMCYSGYSVVPLHSPSPPIVSFVGTPPLIS